jgi:predicted ATPase
MLINSLSLENFKCFEKLDVKFAPITLLTGANSSGKSSLINAILAVLQTEQFPFYLSPNGKYVNMGSFEEMAKKGAKTFDINISINLLEYYSGRISQVHEFYTSWERNVSNDLPIVLAINYGDTSKERDLFHWSLHRNKGEFLFNYKMTFGDDIIFKKYVLEFEKHDLLKPYLNKGKDYIEFTNVPIKSISELLNKTIHNDTLFSIFSNYDLEHSQINESFNYVGSFRQPPQRTYNQKAKAQQKVDIDGESYIDQVIEWEETNPDKLIELNAIMHQIELFDQIQSNKIKGGRFELTVKTQYQSAYASLTDVGFGISQFLPIIVADLQLSDHSCLAVSQPEIHLHPKIQATFGNYLANQIKRTQKQYIVETHSEYLLNRIRLLLVTGELKPADVRVLYFENDGVKSTVHDVEFATDGQVKGAPQGFFDTYGIDVMDIAMNAVG